MNQAWTGATTHRGEAAALTKSNHLVEADLGIVGAIPLNDDAGYFDEKAS
jgi:hypothetical protein